jgi:hypothetical protein
MMIEKAKLIIWDKEFSVPVKYADSVELEAFSDIVQATQRFIANSTGIINESIPGVKAYVKKIAKAIGVTTPDNLFECITPHMLLVGIDEGNAIIALLCGFAYDPEHDIAITFRSNSLIEVGSQDLVSWW